MLNCCFNCLRQKFFIKVFLGFNSNDGVIIYGEYPWWIPVGIIIYLIYYHLIKNIIY